MVHPRASTARSEEAQANLQALREAQAAFLKENYGITPAELREVPNDVREEIAAAWARHWRAQVEQAA
jgi:hypothetical protein